MINRCLQDTYLIPKKTFGDLYKGKIYILMFSEAYNHYYVLCDNKLIIVIRYSKVKRRYIKMCASMNFVFSNQRHVIIEKKLTFANEE